ncbi:MAG: hypothetical protein AAGG55_14680 [Pseudomonadota bacterium]
MPTDLQTAESERCIDNFSLHESDYEHRSRLGDAPRDVTVFSRGDSSGLHLSATSSGSGNRIFLSDGVRGELNVNFEGSDSVIFIGRDTTLTALTIGSRQSDDFVAIGNDVASTGPGRWISGLRAADHRPGIIVGDAVVIARDVVIRNTDGHPIFDSTLSSQVNAASSDLVIEPHSWIGERAAILKNVTIGAFSIVGFAAVVHESVPRHHRAQGNPARVKVNQDRIWAWDDSDDGLARARKYLAKFPINETS